MIVYKFNLLSFITSIIVITVIVCNTVYADKNTTFFSDNFNTRNLFKWEFTRKISNSNILVKNKELQLTDNKNKWGLGSQIVSKKSFNSNGSPIQVTFRLSNVRPNTKESIVIGLYKKVLLVYTSNNNRQRVDLYINNNKKNLKRLSTGQLDSSKNGDRVWSSYLWKSGHLVKQGDYLGFCIGENSWSVIISKDGKHYRPLYAQPLGTKGAGSSKGKFPHPFKLKANYKVSIGLMNSNGHNTSITIDNLSISNASTINTKKITQNSKAQTTQVKDGQVLNVTFSNINRKYQTLVILKNRKANKQYIVGLTKNNRLFINSWKNGKWKHKWREPHWNIDRQEINLHLLHIGELLFVESGAKGNLQTILKTGDGVIDTSTSAESNHEWKIKALPKSVQIPAPEGSKMSLPGPATAFYMGWYPANWMSKAYRYRDDDFPVYPMTNTLCHQVKQMAHYGWTGMAVDFLFFTPQKIIHQYQLMQNFMMAIKQAGLKNFYITPFLETKDPKITSAGIIYMLTRLASSPFWPRWHGRPVIYAYGNQYGNPLPPEEYWKETMGLISQSGWNPFWVIGVGGLKAGLYGKIDKSQYGILSVADGVYDFSASGLEAVARVPQNIRKQFGSQYPNLAIGAFIHPGYLSSRINQRNFISSRGTEFLRNEWNITLSSPHKPDFIGWATWNDYTESTTLSQSYSILTSRLKISQRYLNQYRGLPMPKGKKGVVDAVLSYRKSIYQGEPIKFEFLPLPTQLGPKQGKWHIKLLNETGQVIKETASPTVNLDSMTPWNWTLTKGVKRSKTRVIRVRVTLTLPDGSIKHYANLPDIVVAVPTSYADQLYYSIPLNKLAGSKRNVRMYVNDSDKAAVTALGLRSIKYKATGKGSDKVQVASMRDSHLLRFLAPINTRGAEAVWGQREHTVQIRKLKNNEPSTWTCWAPTQANGLDYFAALAKFPDGKWAYSPTVWTVPPVDPKDIQALWIFAPSRKDKLVISDRSIYHTNLQIPKASSLKFISLPGNGRVLHFNGKSILPVPLDIATPGPVSLEILFRPEKIGRKQILVYQRGAQASLYIDKKGYLAGERLPERRKSHNPFVTVKSNKPLQAGKFYEAVLTFDGKMLRLYVNGQLDNQASCVGTRSTEKFVIGGPVGKNTKVSKSVDNIPTNAFFNGDIARISLFAVPLKFDQINMIYKHDCTLPFWK